MVPAKNSWIYFHALERDLIRTFDYVEPSGANASAYSNEYAKLLMLVGSEIDVVAKQLSRGLPSGATASNITQYQAAITSAFPGMHQTVIEISRYGLSYIPWSTWGSANPISPSWWKAYNSVKHERDINFALASQENVLQSFCGLLVLLLYYYRSVSLLDPLPEVLECGFPDYIVTSGTQALAGLSYNEHGGYASWEPAPTS